MHLEGSAALVVGGASGLGEATVRRLHRAGARLVIADLDEDRGRALAAELGGRAAFECADVSDPDAVRSAVAVAAALTGGLRISASKGAIVSMTLPAARDLAAPRDQGLCDRARHLRHPAARHAPARGA